MCRWEEDDVNGGATSGQASRGANQPNAVGWFAEFEDEFEHTETFARWIEEREAEGGAHAFGGFAS